MRMFKEDNFSLKRTISLLILIMVFSGIFGFVYETIFYRIDLGYFVKRGSTFGPWIPIYAFGGLFITLIAYRFRKNPFLVFVFSVLISGVLEYFTGYVLDNCFHTRLWDYNVEIWNYGNINGYVCLRSISFFGVSSLFLIYLVIPILKKIIFKLSDKCLFIISVILGLLFLLDIILYAIIN